MEGIDWLFVDTWQMFLEDSDASQGRFQESRFEISVKFHGSFNSSVVIITRLAKFVRFFKLAITAMAPMQKQGKQTEISH